MKLLTYDLDILLSFSRTGGQWVRIPFANLSATKQKSVMLLERYELVDTNGSNTVGITDKGKTCINFLLDQLNVFIQPE